MRDPYRNPVWIVLPGTRTYPEELRHRVDPLAADVTMCNRLTAAGEVLPEQGPLPRQCPRCNWRVYRRREVVRENRERDEREAKRRHAQSDSVRTVSGGLPGLGKR
jgi:hypothetical protein